MTRVLVVTDTMKNGWMHSRFVANNPDAHYDILTFGVPPTIVLQENRERFSVLSSCAVVDVNKYSDAAYAHVRTFVTELVAEYPSVKLFGSSSLLDLFRSGSINFWWFNKMSEKGALGTPFTKRIYFIEIIKEIFRETKYDFMLVDTEDCVMADCLSRNVGVLCPVHDICAERTNVDAGAGQIARFLLESVRAFVNVLAHYYVLKGRTPECKGPQGKKTIGLFTFFPFYWGKETKGKRKELFYQSLPEHLADHARVINAAWFVNTFSRLWKKRHEYQKLIANGEIVPLQCYITAGSILKAFGLFCTYAMKLAMYLLFYRPRIKVDKDGFDISRIVANEFSTNALRSEITYCILYMTTIEKYLEKTGTDVLVYRVEFQPHERAVVYGSRKRAKTVAYQHQMFARNHLQYFFEKNEIRAAIEHKSVDTIPVSDLYCVAGQYAYNVFCAAGFPESMLGICGPVRYSGLVTYVKNKPEKSLLRERYGYDPDEHILLIASPVTREEVLAFMLCLIQALGKRNDIRFLVKSHPVIKFEKEIRELLAHHAPLLKFQYLSDAVSLNDYIVLSDAVLMTGTTMGAEAIGLGVVPIVFANNSTYSPNPLIDIKESCYFVQDSEGLGRAVEAVFDKKNTLEALKSNWPAAIRNTFDSLERDPNERFVDLLVQKGLLS